MARSKTTLAYRTLNESLWDAPEWCSVDAGPANPRLLLLYFAAGPLQRSVPGVIRVGECELSDRLQWSVDEVRSCMRQLIEARSIRFDQAVRLVWLPWKYQHEPPANPNVVRGWRSTFERWPSGDLAQSVRAELRGRLVGRGPDFVAAFDELPGAQPQASETVPGNRSGEPLPPTVTPNGPGERLPQTVGGNQRSSEAVRQGKKEEQELPLRHGAVAPPPSSASTEVPGIAKKPRKDGKAAPTAAQKLERQQLRDFWDEGVKNRGGVPLEWGAEGGKRHRLVIELLRLTCGLDGAKAHMGRVFARFDTDDFWRRKGLSFQAAASAGCVEELQTANLAVIRGAGMKTSAHWSGGVPASPRSSFVAEALKEARSHGDAQEIERLDGALRAAVEVEEIESGRSPLTRDQQIATQKRHADELRRSIAADEKELAGVNPHVVAKVGKFKRLAETVQQRRALVAEIERDLALLQKPTPTPRGASIHISEQSKREAEIPGRKFL